MNGKASRKPNVREAAEKYIKNKIMINTIVKAQLLVLIKDLLLLKIIKCLMSFGPFSKYVW